jgi:hypothetical protein
MAALEIPKTPKQRMPRPPPMEPAPLPTAASGVHVLRLGTAVEPLGGVLRELCVRSWALSCPVDALEPRLPPRLPAPPQGGDGEAAAAAQLVASATQLHVEKTNAVGFEESLDSPRRLSEAALDRLPSIKLPSIKAGSTQWDQAQWGWLTEEWRTALRAPAPMLGTRFDPLFAMHQSPHFVASPKSPAGLPVALAWQQLQAAVAEGATTVELTAAVWHRWELREEEVVAVDDAQRAARRQLVAAVKSRQ